MFISDNLMIIDNYIFSASKMAGHSKSKVFKIFQKIQIIVNFKLISTNEFISDRKCYKIGYLFDELWHKCYQYLINVHDRSQKINVNQIKQSIQIPF